MSPGNPRTPGPVSERVRVRRRPRRASYDRAGVDEILDEAMLCRVAFVEDGQPYVFPTTHLRVDDAIYVHGNQRNRMLTHIASGAPVSVESTIVDGLIMGRAVFAHGMNYRSAVVLSHGSEVVDYHHKVELMNALIERLVPGRLEGLRPLSEREVRITKVVALPIEEFSVKTRTGPPDDLVGDRTWPVWAGTIPLRMRTEPPEDDPFVPADLGVPEYAERWGEARTGI